MNYWFVSDTHWNHDKIRGYTNRPHKSLDEMNSALIRNWNSRVQVDDMVFHVGDFCFHNTEGAAHRGEGGPASWKFWWDKLNGNKVLVRGNHDRNNTVKSPIQNMVLELGGIRMGLCHRPAAAVRELSLLGEGAVNLIVCGHVHNSWKSVLYQPALPLRPVVSVPVINVSVEMWKYAPVSLAELLAEKSLRVKSGGPVYTEFYEKPRDEY
jgi:calcineurin-like phosphoesterase family protein